MRTVCVWEELVEEFLVNACVNMHGREEFLTEMLPKRIQCALVQSRDRDTSWLGPFFKISSSALLISPRTCWNTMQDIILDHRFFTFY